MNLKSLKDIIYAIAGRQPDIESNTEKIVAQFAPMKETSTSCEANYETPAITKETPKEAQLFDQLYWPSTKLKTPRKRVPYIPTDESPWVVLKMRGGKWALAFSDLYDTRKDARKDATACRIALNCKTRVVRVIVPTR